MSDLVRMVESLSQRVITLEEDIRLLMDQRQLAQGGAALDITTPVVDSNGRAGSLAQVMYVDSTNQLRGLFTAVCKITAGTAGNWTAKKCYADGTTYGDDITGLSVIGDHGEVGIGNIVQYVELQTSSVDSSLVKKILNYLYIGM